MFKPLKVFLAVGICLIFSGCTSTFLVRDASLDQVIPLFRDYVGINGFQFSYQNDQTHVYRLSLGTIFVPHTSEVIQTTRGNRALDKIQEGQASLVSYHQTTIETVNHPAHYVEAVARVRFLQKDDHVVIHVETDGPIGTSVDDLQKFMELSGYQVEVF